MPPKLILSEAALIAMGSTLPPEEFSGGIEANGYLERLGFRIIDRRRV
jgi:hypothetical protein